jgi:carboxyl-terminal processing protease
MISEYRNYDLVVLTNGFTASAAELFTANMRDYHLATVIGTKTYGKGSVQSLIPLFYYGYEGALKLTTSHYFPPCGEGYDGIGVFPDIEEVLSEEAASVNIYKLAEADDNQLQRALEELRKP